jgi:hypothetical protein
LYENFLILSLIRAVALWVLTTYEATAFAVLYHKYMKQKPHTYAMINTACYQVCGEV